MKHGQKVTINGYLKRVLLIKKGKAYPEWKEWVFSPYEKPKEGILIGKRVLNNGINPYFEHNEYMPKEYFTAYLVSLDMNTNPVYVRECDFNL